MIQTMLDKRLSALEATCATQPVRLTPEERAEAARQYEATLHADDPVSPEAAAYFAAATLLQLSADYTAMLNGAPAPWE